MSLERWPGAWSYRWRQGFLSGIGAIKHFEKQLSFKSIIVAAMWQNREKETHSEATLIAQVRHDSCLN